MNKYLCITNTTMINPAHHHAVSYLQVGELCEGFIAARLDTLIRPITCVDSAGVFGE